MAKRTSAAKAAPSSPAYKGRKLAVQGLAINEIVQLEQEAFQNIRFHLTVVFLATAVLGQLRTSTKLTATEFSKLESVRAFNKRVLAKSEAMCSVAAAVAIRRTLTVYAAEADNTKMLQDYQELVENTSGPSGTSDNVRACLNDPARLRKLRRGYMLQTVGSVQATAIHSHTSIGPDLGTLSKDNFLSALPFETSDINIDDIYAVVKELLNLEEEYTFQDCVTLAGSPTNNVTLLETPLGYSRSLSVTLAQLQIPTVSDSDPLWKKLAVQAAKGTFKS